MAIILNIETSTTNCSVSLSNKGETLVLKEDNNVNYSHAEYLHLFIDDVMKVAKQSIKHIDAIAISKGPGSYTGLRIGVSAAKGLCFALNVPLISISTLKVLAHKVKIGDGLIVAMLDARRLEVYSAIYDASYNEIRGVQAQVLNEDAFTEYLKHKPIYFIGNGVKKTKELITHPNAIFVEDKFPSANEMSFLAYQKYKKNDIEDVAYFEPFYLKDFIAVKSKK